MVKRSIYTRTRTVYHFQGVLTADHVAQHIPHTFQVPDHTERLDVHFRFTPTEVDGINNLICLTLFDPSGFRGAGHRHSDTHRVEVSAGGATPGYLAGPLLPGPWIVELDTHMVMPGGPCHYQLDVTVCVARESETTPVETVLHCEPPGRVINPDGLTRNPPADRGAGWYRGDLHTHTVHSDGEWDVAGLLTTAGWRGLDFVAVTDHNTVSGLAEIDRAAEARVLAIGGMELTTFWGHAVCVGTRRWIDWRVPREGGAMAAIARQVYDQGQLFIIAHPCSVGSPICTGCEWEYADMQPGPGQLVEVWNGPWPGEVHNEQALALWYHWLNQGYRLVATTGGDAHSEQDVARELAFNAVYARAFSEEAILRAIREGHLYLSTGPRLVLTGYAGQGSPAMMGDWLAGENVTLTVGWADCPARARVRVVADGQPIAEWPAADRGSHSWTLTAGQARWCVVEVRGDDGHMLALTNPIFLKGSPSPRMEVAG